MVRVLHGVTGETMSIMSTVFLLSSSVAKIKSLVSLKCDLPVGAFRLSTPSGVQLYDCNRLHDYAIEVGTACCVLMSAIQHQEFFVVILLC